MKSTLLRILFALITAIPSLAHTYFYRMETLKKGDHLVLLISDWHESISGTEESISGTQERALIANIKTHMPNAMVYAEDPINRVGQNQSITDKMGDNYLEYVRYRFDYGSMSEDQAKSFHSSLSPEQEQQVQAMLSSYEYLNAITRRLEDAGIQAESIDCRCDWGLIETNQVTGEEYLKDIEATIEMLRKNNPRDTPIGLHIHKVLNALRERDQEFYAPKDITKRISDYHKFYKFYRDESNLKESMPMEHVEPFSKYVMCHAELVDLLALDGIAKSNTAKTPVVVIAGGYHCSGISRTLQYMAGYTCTHTSGIEIPMPSLSIYRQLYNDTWFKNDAPEINTPNALTLEQIEDHIKSAAAISSRSNIQHPRAPITTKPSTTPPPSSSSSWLTPKKVAAGLGLIGISYLAYRYITPWLNKLKLKK